METEREREKYSILTIVFDHYIKCDYQSIQTERAMCMSVHVTLFDANEMRAGCTITHRQ